MAANKQQQTNDEAQHLAILIAALQRAIKVLEGRAGKTPAELEAGGYPVSITIGITGDITVGPATETADCMVLDFKPDDVLFGVLAEIEGAEDFLTDAVELIKAARSDNEAKAQLADAKALYESRIDHLARAHRLRKNRPGTRRKGAVTGKPALLIRGTAGAHTVSIEVSDEEKQAA